MTEAMKEFVRCVNNYFARVAATDQDDETRALAQRVRAAATRIQEEEF